MRLPTTLKAIKMSNTEIQDNTEAHMGTVTDVAEDDSVMNSSHAPKAGESLMEIRPRMDDAYTDDEQAPGVIVPKRTIEMPPGSDSSAG